MIDLHRHDEWSTFDGYGNTNQTAQRAKELGYTSLGISNHGTVNGLIRHYNSCKELGIKPVLGVEAYFKPKFKETRKFYHLCIFCKNYEGYKTMNRVLFEAEKQKYYYPIVTFDVLEKYNKDLIVTSACIASFISQSILKGKINIAEKALNKFKSIFGDDFYIEIQPYKIDNEGTQEKVNEVLMELGEKLNIKCILTSDSHYIRREEFDSYKKMHEIANHNYDIEMTYKERYMPSEEELIDRFIKMHGNKKLAKKFMKNLEELENKIVGDIFEEMKIELPKFDKNKDSKELLTDMVKAGLKKRGKWNKKYIKRAKEELSVIFHHGFEDYFLIVADYTNWAKNHGICVGPGRGSGCNSIVNYVLGITEVDSVRFDLEFKRFLRKDKLKMPDIDLDFETERRAEVMQYLIEKYKNCSSQICSYGLYKVDNLINDLAKTCGLETSVSIDSEIAKENKIKIKEIKSFINKFMEAGEIDEDKMKMHKMYKRYNDNYDNILHHFLRLYKKVRFIGTHAAGIALTKGNILDYVPLRINKKDGKIFTAYDLVDLETIKIIKFDILGLKTMESLGQLRKIVGINKFNEDILDDTEVMKNFKKGNTDGVFQFESKSAKGILTQIGCDTFEDIIAASSMNRPGPLSLGIADDYANNKQNVEECKNKFYYEYTKDTYGTLIYQEQIQRMVTEAANMSWADADVMIKMQKGSSRKQEEVFNAHYKEFKTKFLNGCKKNGINVKDAEEVYERIFNYSFNKGHGTGYSLISLEEMWFKVHYPVQFWMNKLKLEGRDEKRVQYKSSAVKDGCLILLPHVNGKAYDSITKLDGEKVIQEGLTSIKGVGEKAALVIESMGQFIDYPDFEEKFEELPKEKRRCITKKVIKLLKDSGAFEFNDKVFLKKVERYNSYLYGKEFNNY